MPPDTHFPAQLAAMEAEQSGHPEPHELIECLFCGEIHTGDCIVPVPAGESYAEWRERNEERMWAERERAPGKW